MLVVFPVCCFCDVTNYDFGNVLFSCISLFFQSVQVKQDMAYVSTFTEVRSEPRHPAAEDENPMEAQMSGDSLGESPWRKVPTLLSPGKCVIIHFSFFVPSFLSLSLPICMPFRTNALVEYTND